MCKKHGFWHVGKAKQYKDKHLGNKTKSYHCFIRNNSLPLHSLKISDAENIRY